MKSSGRRPRWILVNGERVPYGEARVHLLSTAMKYAAVVFEGIRAYAEEPGGGGDGQLYVFRLPDHVRRLCESARLAGMRLPLAPDELSAQVLEIIRANGQREDLHIRVLVYVEEDNGGLDSTGPVSLAVAPVPMGRYPDPEPSGGGGRPGLSVCTSTWTRIGEASMPPRIKATANYHNSRLALLEARARGFDDAVITDGRGRICEGPGYNIFVARRGRVLTPPVTSGILEGVTRDTLIRLFADRFRVVVEEREIDRTELLLADEAWFCGSGKEVVPIRAVDGHELGRDAAGPLWSARIAKEYFAVARGAVRGYAEWRTPVW